MALHRLFRAEILRSVSFGLTACGLLAISGLSAQAQSANPQVEMVIEKRGTIVVELLPKAAPKTVAHFLELVNKKFYDGVLFHRVIPGFVAQGGDPKSKKYKPEQVSNEQQASALGLGIGGSNPKEKIPLEATVSHDRGTLGLARSAAPDSGDSQFFFNLVPNHRLDNQYCVFGKIVKGLDVMDKIGMGDRIKSAKQLKTTPDKKKK